MRLPCAILQLVWVYRTTTCIGAQVIVPPYSILMKRKIKEKDNATTRRSALGIPVCLRSNINGLLAFSPIYYTDLASEYNMYVFSSGYYS